MAAPTVVGVGTVASGTTAITPAFPASLTVGDILIGIGESVGNQAYTVPTGWAHVLGSPVNVDTSTRLTVIWRRFQAGDVALSWGDSGNHNVGRIIAIRGAKATGDPWNVSPVTSQETAANTSAEWPSVITAAVDCLIVLCIATGRDITSTANLGAVTNGALTSITEQMDNWTASGTGGGIGMVTGIKAAAGAVGTSTATMGSSDAKASMTIAVEAAAGGTSFPVDQTDSVGLTDAATVEVVKTVTQTDSTGLTDARVVEIQKAVVDGAGLTDTAQLSQSKIPTDSTGLTDSSAVELAKLVAQTDDAGLTDTAALSQTKIVTDSAGLTDTTGLSQQKTVTDSAGLTDAVVLESGKVITQTDDAGLTDTLAVAQTHVLSDSVGLTDAAALAQSKILTDTAGLTDTVATGVLRDLVAADSAGLTDTQVFARSLGFEDLAGLTDAAAVTQSNVVSDNAGLSDSVSPVLGAAITVGQVYPRHRSGSTVNARNRTSAGVSVRRRVAATVSGRDV